MEVKPAGTALTGEARLVPRTNQPRADARTGTSLLLPCLRAATPGCDDEPVTSKRRIDVRRPPSPIDFKGPILYRPSTPPVPQTPPKGVAPKPIDASPLMITHPKRRRPSPVPTPPSTPQPVEQHTPRYQSPVPITPPRLPTPISLDRSPSPTPQLHRIFPIDYSPIPSVRPRYVTPTWTPLERPKRNRTPSPVPSENEDASTDSKRPQHPVSSHAHIKRVIISRRKGLRLGTLNCQTLVEHGRIDMIAIKELTLYCIKQDIDMLAIQEHKYHFEHALAHTVQVRVETTMPKYFLIMAPATRGNNTVSGGCAWLVSESIYEVLGDVQPIAVDNEYRLLNLTLTKPHHMNMVCVYAPTADAADAKRKEFLSELRSHTLLSKNIIIAGDFNAALRPLPPWIPYGHRQPMGADANEAAEDLRLLVLELGLIAIDCWNHKPRHFTFISPDNGRRVPIDHILCNRALVHRGGFDLQCCRPPIPSDHRLLTCVIRKHAVIKMPRKHARKPRPDYAQLRTSKYVREKFLECYRNLRQASTDIALALRQAIAELPTKRPMRVKEIINHPNIKNARTQVENAPEKDVRCLFSQLKQQHKLLNDINVEFLCHWIDSTVKHDPKLGYDLVKRVARKQVPTDKIKANSKAERLEKIQAHCSLQLQNPIGLHKIRFEKVHELHYKTSSFTMDELKIGVRQMENGKAPGHDGISNEMLKLEELHEDLLLLLNDCLDKGEVPDCMKITKFTMIPKANGKLNTVEGWRYIALMPVITKLLNRLILNRLVSVIAPHLGQTQNGFLSKRNTLQHVLALRLISEAYRTRKMGSLFVTYVDFANAFPSVSHASIVAALQAFSVPEKLIKLIISVYKAHTAYVSTADGDTGTFRPTAGVLQGDTLAPFLFILILDRIMRKAVDKSQTLGVGPSNLRDLTYADDIALLATNAEDAQRLLDRVTKYAYRAGLVINKKKTQYQVIGDETSDTLKIGDDKIQRVENYRYLGVQTDTDADLASRAGQAWERMREMRIIWRSPTITTNTKILLWTATVVPIILYGAPTYQLTQRRQDRLRAICSRMLRWIKGYSPSDHVSTEVIFYNLTLPTTNALIRLRNIVNTTPEQHPLKKLVQWAPAGKLRAGRFHLLKTQIEDVMQRQSQNLANELETSAYNALGLRRKSTSIGCELRALAKRARESDDYDDCPIAQTPWSIVNSKCSTKKKLQRLEAVPVQGMKDAVAILKNELETPITHKPMRPNKDEKHTYYMAVAESDGRYHAAAYCVESPECSFVSSLRKTPNNSVQLAAENCLANVLRVAGRGPLVVVSPLLAGRSTASPVEPTKLEDWDGTWNTKPPPTFHDVVIWTTSQHWRSRIERRLPTTILRATKNDFEKDKNFKLAKQLLSNTLRRNALVFH